MKKFWTRHGDLAIQVVGAAVSAIVFALGTLVIYRAAHLFGLYGILR